MSCIEVWTCPQTSSGFDPSLDLMCNALMQTRSSHSLNHWIHRRSISSTPRKCLWTTRAMLTQRCPSRNWRCRLSTCRVRTRPPLCGTWRTLNPTAFTLSPSGDKRTAPLASSWLCSTPEWRNWVTHSFLTLPLGMTSSRILPSPWTATGETRIPRTRATAARIAQSRAGTDSESPPFSQQNTITPMACWVWLRTAAS